MRNRHLESKLTGNTTCMYLFALDFYKQYRNEKAGCNSKAQKLVAFEDLECFVRYTIESVCAGLILFLLKISSVHWIYITVMQ